MLTRISQPEGGDPSVSVKLGRTGYSVVGTIEEFLALRVLILLLLLLSLLAHAEAPAEFLVLSDLHYNPFVQHGLPRRGEDTTGELLRSSLDEAQRRCPSPRFILLTGDLLAHDWEELYAEHSPGQDFREVTGDTVADVAAEMHQRWPNTPIFPVLGNEDAFEGNYQVQPDGPFLERFSQIWAPLTGSPAQVQATLQMGGYWSVPMPGRPDRQLVGLNSVFFSARRTGPDDGSPHLDWLNEELGRLEQAGKRAWLVMHIPPGLDNYYTVRAFEAGRPDPVELWQAVFLERFLAVIKAHPGTVEAAFAGHTHRDDFRMVAPGVPCKIVPSISPVYENNPGFGVFQADLSDYRMYFLDLENPRWKLEYSYREAYGLESLDLVKLDSLLQPGTNAATLFARFYSVSGPLEVNDGNLEVYRSSILHLIPRQPVP